MSAPRNRSGENRFYCAPPMRKQNQEQLLRQSKLNRAAKPKPAPPSAVAEKGVVVESDDNCSSSSSVNTVSFSPPVGPCISPSNNLDRFLEHTTPVVQAQNLSRTSMKQLRTSEDKFHPYFVLGDLWESFKEWSAYGAGVPLVMNGSDSVVQYYVPFLSGIQLYIDPSKPSMSLRRPGEESDADSSRETSSDGSDCGAESGNNHVQGAWSLHNNMRAMAQSFNHLSIDEGEISNPPGLLLFEYFESAPPFSREPLADKIAVLASRFPQLKTCRSWELTAASWISVAWYPIYRIPTGPTLQNLDACFLTFHSLSTPFPSSRSTDSLYTDVPTAKQLQCPGMPLKLLLPILGLASYKFKVSVWNPTGDNESQKLNSLLQSADKWLRSLQVDHPDYKFFVSHNLYM